MTIKKNAAAAYFFRLFCISNPAFQCFNVILCLFSAVDIYFGWYNLLESHGPPSVPNQKPKKASVNFEEKLLEEKYIVSNFCNEIMQNVQLPS